VSQYTNSLKNPKPGDFNDLLDVYQIDAPEDEYGMWNVNHADDGVIAAFLHENDAFLFRLMKINIELNGK